MALYELTPHGLNSIEQSTFTALNVLERNNIQKSIRAHIHAIMPGTRTMVLAEEFGDWIDANRRIDLLCLDEEARLIVVELKRDNSAHMELQALRYAAMISTMRFDQAVEAHRKYLRSINSEVDPEKEIRDFLEIDDGPVALSETVRIVLASSDFSTELTTTVLWLNKQGMDVRCVQMRPHPLDGRIFLDIQQIIPLPAAEQYQVALREKTMEQVAARSQARDMTRFDLTIGERTFTNLPKRRLIYEIVAEAIKRGVAPTEISAAVLWRESSMFLSAPGTLTEADARKLFEGKPLDRYYIEDKDIFHFNSFTYILSNQWDDRTLEAVSIVQKLMPSGDAISFSPTTRVIEDVMYKGYRVKRRASQTIEVEREGALIEPVMPILRELALSLGVSLNNARGNPFNTRQLGAQVIRAISEL